MHPNVFLCVGFQTHLLFISKGKLSYFLFSVWAKSAMKLVKTEFSYSIEITFQMNSARRNTF